MLGKEDQRLPDRVPEVPRVSSDFPGAFAVHPVSDSDVIVLRHFFQNHPTQVWILYFQKFRRLAYVTIELFSV